MPPKQLKKRKIETGEESATHDNNVEDANLGISFEAENPMDVGSSSIPADIVVPAVPGIPNNVTVVFDAQLNVQHQQDAAQAPGPAPAPVPIEQATLGVSTGREGKPGRRGRGKKNGEDVPWLQVEGGPCYSERQLQQASSGMDMTGVKKKYKVMKCLACAEYNPSTPWAEFRPRKYEAATFSDHQQSSHHVKSVALKANAEGDLALAAATLAAKVGHSFIGSDSDNEDADKDAAVKALQAHFAGKNMPSSSTSASSSSSTAAPTAIIGTVPDITAASTAVGVGAFDRGATGATATDAAGGAVAAGNGDGEVGEDAGQGPSAKKAKKGAPTPEERKRNKKAKKLENLLRAPKPKTHSTRGDLVPAWLKTEGGLTISPKQLANHPNPEKLKKKYRNVLCTYCQVSKKPGLYCWRLRSKIPRV